MEKEQKELLLKDLCARLPYGVKVVHKDENSKKDIITTLVGYNGHYAETFIDGLCYHLDLYEFKPFLRPMSKMTNSVYDEYLRIKTQGKLFEVIDWLNAHHFDYRGLIEKGLALEATKDMYNNK